MGIDPGRSPTTDGILRFSTDTISAHACELWGFIGMAYIVMVYHGRCSYGLYTYDPTAETIPVRTYELNSDIVRMFIGAHMHGSVFSVFFVSF